MFFYVFAALGLTWVITRSKILSVFREWVNWSVLRCDQCIGLYAGALLGYLYTQDYKQTIIAALSTSAAGFISSKQFPNLTGKLPKVVQTDASVLSDFTMEI